MGNVNRTEFAFEDAGELGLLATGFVAVSPSGFDPRSRQTADHVFARNS
jgi:hypothetical protein